MVTRTAKSSKHPRAQPPGRSRRRKLWELREESGTNIYRILYFMASGRRIVLLHAFQKKTRKTPRREIEVARIRMERLLASEARR
jgi:phage-related protein